MFAFDELHFRHVLDGCVSLPKKIWLRVWPIYYLVHNFVRHVLVCLVLLEFSINCLIVFIFYFLSMLTFSSHICSWCVWFATVPMLCSLSCLRICFFGYLIGPLS